MHASLPSPHLFVAGFFGAGLFGAALVLGFLSPPTVPPSAPISSSARFWPLASLPLLRSRYFWNAAIALSFWWSCLYMSPRSHHTSALPGSSADAFSYSAIACGITSGFFSVCRRYTTARLKWMLASLG